MATLGTGFLYGNGTDEMSGQTPVCCTPEYLAAFGIGLDSTYGDGKVQGVLREDQAEQQFHAMYADEYKGADKLQAITKELTTFVEGMEGDDIDVDQLFKKAQAAMKGDAPAEGEEADPNVAKLVKILTKIETAVGPMEEMLTNFFGKDVVKAAAGGDENEGPRGLALLMAQTVISSYDTGNGNPDDDPQDSNNVNAVLQKSERKGEGVITVSLGEIFQWALETNVFMDVYNKAGGGDSVTDFANKAYTAMSEGDTATFNAIADAAGMTPEQLQVVLSAMMNNHSNLMATKGTMGTSTKNGAHQFLNNIQDSQMIQAGGGLGDGGNNKDQAFQLLHIGNIGATGNQNGNDNLNTTRDSIKNGDANAIFTAGDNANNNNGDIEAALNKEGFGDTFSGGKDYTTGMKAKAPEALLEGADGDKIKSELLADLSSKGFGKILDDKTTADESAHEVIIDDKTYGVSVTDSEDFENEGYDVVIITITDPETGMVVGSFTATEDGASERLVEFADNDGDGLVDAVDEETGLSGSEFDAEGISEGTYGDDGRGTLEKTGTEGTDYLALNEDGDDLLTQKRIEPTEEYEADEDYATEGLVTWTGNVLTPDDDVVTPGGVVPGMGIPDDAEQITGAELKALYPEGEVPPVFENLDDDAVIMTYTIGTTTYYYSTATGMTYTEDGRPAIVPGLI